MTAVDAASLSPRRRWAALIVLSTSLLVVVMDMTILNIALPDLAADMRPGASQQLWIVDVYSLMLAGLLVPMSVLADRVGRRRMLLAGFVLFGGASALVLLAGTPAGVIAVRALLGVAGAMIMPTTLSMIRTVFTDPAERARALGVWAATASLGAAAGPIVGGLLLERFSWHAAFLVNVPLMAVALVAGRLILPEARGPAPRRLDALSTVLSVAGMAGTVWAIKRMADEGAGDIGAWAVLAGAVALLAWFVMRCLRRPDPMLDMRLLARTPVAAGIVAALVSSLSLAAVLLLVAQWLQLVEGHSPLDAGVRLLPLAAAATLASLAAPSLAERIGVRPVMAGGLVAAAAGFLALVAAPDPLGYGAIVAMLILLGAGSGSLAIGSAMIMASTPPERAADAAAFEESAYEVGAVLGVAVLGGIAAALYRGALSMDTLAAMGLGPGLADRARESLGAAADIAATGGSADLAALAGTAFSDALPTVALVGGLLLAGAGALVWFLTPRRIDLSGQEH